MDRIDRKAEEMGRTRTVRAAKAVDGPVGNGADGPGQVMFQVIGRPDGQGGDDVRFLPQTPRRFFPINVSFSFRARNFRPRNPATPPSAAFPPRAARP